MWTKKFWKATAERAIRGAAASMLSVSVVGGGILNAFDADWKNVVGVGIGGSVVSLLMSLGGNAASGNGPALNSAEQVVE